MGRDVRVGKQEEKTEANLVFEERGVHYTELAVRELADVASEKDRVTSLDLLYNGLLEVLNLSVHVYSCKRRD